MAACFMAGMFYQTRVAAYKTRLIALARASSLLAERASLGICFPESPHILARRVMWLKRAFVERDRGPTRRAVEHDAGVADLAPAAALGAHKLVARRFQLL